MGKHLITFALALFALSWSSNVNFVSARSRAINTEAIKEDFKAAVSAFDAIFNWTMAILPKVKLSDFQHFERLNNKTIKDRENAVLSDKKANETRYQRSDSDNNNSSPTPSTLPELESSGPESKETTSLPDDSNSNSESDAEAEPSVETTTKAPSNMGHSLTSSNMGHFTALFFVFISIVTFYM